MATVKFGSTISGIRGTIGGVTFSHNAAGPYAKSWERPVNPQSPLQTGTRGPLTQMGNLWRSLTVPARAAWNAYALAPAELDTNSLGMPVTLSGFAWFVRVNMRRVSVGAGLQTLVPTSTRPVTPYGLSAICQTPYPTDGSVAVGFNPLCFVTPQFCIVTASVGSGTGMLNQTAGYRIMYAALKIVPNYVNCGTKFVSVFGKVPAGMKVFFQLQAQTADGIRSLAGLVSCVVA
jgi:hypothetical protein